MTEEFKQALTELIALTKQQQCAIADLEQRVFFLEQHTGLGNGLTKPIFTPAGVEQAKAKYIIEGREKLMASVLSQSFSSDLINNLTSPNL